MEQVFEVPRLKRRAKESHKGDFGKALIVAGSFGMSGAAALAGRAALRGGSGLVRVAVPKSILPIVAAIEPCYTTIPLPEDEKGRMSAKSVHIILEAAAENDVLAFGPGVGVCRGAAVVLERLLAEEKLKLIIDADGINNLAKVKGWILERKAELILTPHPGEMKRLWESLLREKLPLQRVEQAARLAQKTGAVVVLKGAGTVISDGKRYYVNTTGNPGMATAGSGDVLTGIITSFVGQGFAMFESAVLAVYTHGLAGDIAAAKYGEVSLIATDIIDCIAEAIKKIVIE